MASESSLSYTERHTKQIHAIAVEEFRSTAQASEIEEQDLGAQMKWRRLRDWWNQSEIKT